MQAFSRLWETSRCLVLKLQLKCIKTCNTSLASWLVWHVQTGQVNVSLSRSSYCLPMHRQPRFCRWKKAFDKIEHGKLIIVFDQLGFCRTTQMSSLTAMQNHNCLTKRNMVLQMRIQTSRIPQGCPLALITFVVMVCVDFDMQQNIISYLVFWMTESQGWIEPESDLLRRLRLTEQFLQKQMCSCDHERRLCIHWSGPCTWGMK